MPPKQRKQLGRGILSTLVKFAPKILSDDSELGKDFRWARGLVKKITGAGKKRKPAKKKRVVKKK